MLEILVPVNDGGSEDGKVLREGVEVVSAARTAAEMCEEDSRVLRSSLRTG